MHEVRWERMFPDQLEAAFQKCPLVYFPYGLCEPHGPQNAVGLDALKAHAIACAAARAGGGIVAPPDYWHIHEVGGYANWGAENVGEVRRKWMTAVPPWIHFKNVCYHVRTADVLGFQAAIFLTGHYGPNWQDLKTVLELLQPFTKTRLFGLPDFEANQPGFDDGSSGDHAGKVETSLLWAVEPDCVDMSRLPETVWSGANPAHRDRISAPGIPLEGAAIATSSPFFAMGRDALDASRTIGERMVADEVQWLTKKAEALLEQYDKSLDAPGLPTFADVERVWLQVIRPRIAEFKSMASSFDRGEPVQPGSVWYDNRSVALDDVT